MTFANAAARLCGQCALALGWRPDEFWRSTPAELDCVLAAFAEQQNLPPDTTDLNNLMELFPDG
jgi:uncharacterized phage protein (TIGR02216 family)